MYTSEQLQFWRMKGDADADETIAGIAAQNSMIEMRTFMTQLTDFKNFDTSTLPQLAQNFIRNHPIPGDFDLKKIKLATEFFGKNNILIGLCLGCYSLPYCYLGADGARVLVMTERIKKDTFQRLLETGEFVNGIMNFEDWQNGKQAIRIAKIRLMHAMVRFFVNHSKQWDNAWGVPVNQEDMAGTNLAFSFIVLRGLRKMGLNVSPQAEDAYLYLWHVVGHMNGVVSDLNPLVLKDARNLDTMIAKRNFRASEQGKTLTESLINSLRKFQNNPVLKELPIAQMRMLLGQKHADMLGVPATSFQLPIVQLGNTLNAVYQQLRTITS